LKFIANSVYHQRNETTERHRIKYDISKNIAKPPFIPLRAGLAEGDVRFYLKPFSWRLQKEFCGRTWNRLDYAEPATLSTEMITALRAAL
jgi:hypothetical protein